MDDFPVTLLEGWEIVVLDDEEDSLEVARFILDFYGAQVHTGDNGKDGLELVKKLKPKFVISDLSMPGMDGWEFMREIRTNRATSEIPVIALTAHAMAGDRERAIAAGFHNYLTKPLTANTFIHDLVKLLVDIPVLAGDLNLERKP